MENNINKENKSEIIKTNNTKKDKETPLKVIYNGNECKVIKTNNDELLLEIHTVDYFTGENVKLNQWVKLEATKQVD